MVENIILANPRGYCAGVDRAIITVEKALEMYGKPVYVRHEIVHNKHVCDELKRKGALFVEELNEVPKGSVLILSAHGTDPKIKDNALSRFKLIDAVCPLVTKVHLEAVKYSRKDYDILLIGHKGHQEVIGTMGEADMQLIETVSDVEHVSVKDPEKVVYLTQTTLSVDETKDIIEALKQKYPKIIMPPVGDICYATTNRQAAVKELCKKVELILVVGAENSSNSVRLVETAKNLNVNAYLIPDKDAIQDEWFHNVKNVGLSSGASVPDVLVQEVIEHIQKNNKCDVETLEHIKENMTFSLPIEIREP
tara:strand:- start:950 stop:1873 length:924 start_codon:yes stop_codon:yes gene_type:complete